MAAAAADTDTEVGTPYVNVLRYSALGVFASCYAKHLFDQTRFPELAKLTGVLRDCADSSVLRTLAAERRADTDALYTAARGSVPYSKLAVAQPGAAEHETVPLPVYALALLPDLLKAIRDTQTLHSWAIEHKITGSEVRLGTNTYRQISMWELAGLLDSNAVYADLSARAPLFDCVLLPQHQSEAVTLFADALSGTSPDYLTMVLPRPGAARSASEPLPALLTYHWIRAAQTLKQALAAVDRRRRATTGARRFAFGTQYVAVAPQQWPAKAVSVGQDNDKHLARQDAHTAAAATAIVTAPTADDCASVAQEPEDAANDPPK